MRKFIAFGSAILGAFAHSHSHTQTVEVSAWPPLNLYTTFFSDATLHQWNQRTKKLDTYKDI